MPILCLLQCAAIAILWLNAYSWHHETSEHIGNYAKIMQLNLPGWAWGDVCCA